MHTHTSIHTDLYSLSHPFEHAYTHITHRPIRAHTQLKSNHTPKSRHTHTPVYIHLYTYTAPHPFKDVEDYIAHYQRSIEEPEVSM